MADPADAATAAVSDEDVEDLYADLDDQIAAALAAAGESGGSNTKESDPATDAEAEANETVDLGDGLAVYTSSDEESEDDIRIVLNEDGCAPPPPSADRCEEGWVEESEGEVRGSLFKGPYVNDGDRGKLGGLHYKGLLGKTTVPITGQGDRGHQHAFQKDYYFFLPRNRTVFDINIEVFQQKPWRQHGVDLTDYFNFGLNEEGWRKYCIGMKQFRQGARSLPDESSGLDQEPHCNLESIELMPKSAAYSGSEGTKGSDDLAKPKGRAIRVEGGMFERLPSADMWRPRQRDSDDVVIQVNMMLSPSNHSTSDDNSTVNDKCITNERISTDKPGVKCLKDSSLVVDRVVDKEVHDGGSSDSTRSKLDIRDLACARDRSPSPDYSDTLSEELTEDCYFKRSNRHSNSKDLYADTKPKNVHAKSDFCRHSSKSDQESSKSDSHSYTPSSADDRYHNHKKAKLPRTDAPECIYKGIFINRGSDRRLLKSGHKGMKEETRHTSAGARQNVFEKEEKITDRYPSRYARKDDHRNAVHIQVYEKHDHSPLERASLRNGVQCFSNNSNYQRRRSSWHEFNDDEDGMHCFSSARRLQQHRDHGYGYNSMLKAELSDEIDGRRYRESYYQETRRVRHGHSEDDEFFHYTDYKFGKLQGPEVRGKDRNRRCAESNNEHLRHPYHLGLSPPQANDYFKNSERDWPSPGLTSLRSRNRCNDNKRIQNPKVMQYHPDEYDEKNEHHHGLSFRIDNVPQSALYTAAVETGYCSLPANRRLHTDLGSTNHKDLANFSFAKGRRLSHDQLMISDRKLYASDEHSSPNEFDREAIYSFSDMRNSNAISEIRDERRHEHVSQTKDADNSHLNGRKRKFKRQGNEIRREVESDNEGRPPAVKGLHNFKHKHLHQKVRKLNRSYHHSIYQGLEKTTCQEWKSVVSINEEDEIEEGELIEQDHHDTVPKNKVNKQREAVLKSVVEVNAAVQLEVVNATSKGDACDKGAARECDDKHILEAMAKMQKRRERFKEPVITQKEEDIGKDEVLTVECSGDVIKNQRPARKRRWGGSD